MCLLALAIPSLYLGGPWAVEKFLGQELALGQGRLRILHPRFTWRLNLAADSLAYHAPGLRVLSGAAEVSVDLFRSMMRFAPAVRVDLDGVEAITLPSSRDSIAKKPAWPLPDSLAWVDFPLPVALQIRAKLLAWSDTSGKRLSLHEVVLRNLGANAFEGAIGRLQAKALDSIAFSLRMHADWSGDSVRFRTVLGKALPAGLGEDNGKAPGDKSLGYVNDTVALELRGPKSNLLRSEAQVRLFVASLGPYTSAFRLPPDLPSIHGMQVAARAGLSRGLRLRLDAHASLSHFPPGAPYRLTPQSLALTLAFADSQGHWTLASHGQAGEKIKAEGSMHAAGLSPDSLLHPAAWRQHGRAEATVTAQGIPLVVAGKSVVAEARLQVTRLSLHGFQMEMRTGDASHLAADLNRNGDSWDGDFSAALSSQERWIRAFIDTAIVFHDLKVKGRVERNQVEAATSLAGLSAFGLKADSVTLRHRYADGQYSLLPSSWSLGAVTWELQGKVDLARPARPMEFHLHHPDFGHLDFRLPAGGHFLLRCENLSVHRLPFRGLDTFALHQPRLSGSAEWNRPRKSGSALLSATGDFSQENLKARLAMQWSKQGLQVDTLAISLGTSELSAGGFLDLHGRDISELRKFAIADLRSAYLGAADFDLAKVLGLILSPSPIAGGKVHGRLSYEQNSGLEGEYQVEGLRLQATDSLFTLKALNLSGHGDSLLLEAVTTSEKQALLNDTLKLVCTGLLAGEQPLRAHLSLGPDLRIEVDGRMLAFRRFLGRLRLGGNHVLPGQAGSLRDLRLNASFDVPFEKALERLEIRADTLQGRYLLSGIDPQSFSAPFAFKSGKLSIPDLRLRTLAGEAMRGHAAYDLSSKSWQAMLQGDSLALPIQTAGKANLYGFRVVAQSDSASLEVNADIAAVAAEYAQPPLRVGGRFSSVSLLYRLPMGRRAGDGVALPASEKPAFLKVDLVMDTSLVRYRLGSIAAMQNLFKRNGPAKRGGKRGRPLQVQIEVETLGSGNALETDLVRAEYVGDFSLRGTLPYALATGRINALQGQLGTKRQGYDIQNFELKWLNAPIEEGLIQLEAQKRMARDCEAGTLDSCFLITRLTGTLAQMQFAYDSDCQGSFGAGADVGALLYSVRRGCYSPAFSSGSGGQGYQATALSLLEPFASEYLSDAASKLSGKWIASAKVSGLGALSSRGKSDSGSQASGQNAISIEVLSKEVKRLRLRAGSTYTPENAEADNPWDYRLALEWRPPLERWIDDSLWRQRLRNKVKVEAAMFTDQHSAIKGREEEVRRSLGLTYGHDFWGPRRIRGETAPEVSDSLSRGGP